MTFARMNDTSLTRSRAIRHEESQFTTVEENAQGICVLGEFSHSILNLSAIADPSHQCPILRTDL
jgi:hypothetical protein